MTTAEDIHDLDDMVNRRLRTSPSRKASPRAGERIVITGGVPLGVTGTTNMLRVARLGTK